MSRSLLLVTSLAGALVGSVLTAEADSPREFLYKAQQGSNSEIMLGRLATQHGRSPAVRNFGQTLVEDHRQARDDIRALGAQFGVRTSRDPSAEAIEERQRLMTTNGRRFDREFIRYMIQDHEKDIAEFRDEAREGHGQVSALARRQLPTLQHHLEIARSLGNDDGRVSGSFEQSNDRDVRRNRDANR
jgi:putative membrane protein